VGIFGRKYKCQTCGAKFDSEGKLSEHAKIHTQAAPQQAAPQQAADAFTCATCGATFASEAHLDEHVRKDHLDFVDVK
jgi:DNA-directed RNA polymerase subunit RPC12/RpoP